MDVLQFSQQTKQDADDLLKQGNVLAILSKYGTVHLTGAYKYDLMWEPDIDIIVVTDNPEEASLHALNKCIEGKNFRKYQLGDFIHHPLEGRPHGMIMVLIHEYKGRKWEIEIWFQKTLSENNSDLDTLISSANEEQKKIILELKHQRETGDLSKHTLNSSAIYRGVLSEGKVNIEDY